MRAAIIIPVYNRRDDLRECLLALPEETLRTRDCEVIVVDDGSTDGAGEMVAAEFPHVRLARTEGNSGPAHARNIGSRLARGALLVYLDSDAVPEPGWLDALLAHDDGDTVLIGHTLDYHTGVVQGGPRRATFIGKSLPCRTDRANTGPSCNLAAPRRCFDAVNGFDESIPYYFEDSFFCINARRAGFRFTYVAEAVVRHKGSAVRQGQAIRLQEHNSVYAMLGLYRRSWPKLLAFTAANGCWLAWRVLYWGLTGRIGDVRLLLDGWTGAHKRFLTSGRHK